jgi:hypothetical protein
MDVGRPVVTWKFGASLDGRLAAADGSSQWITSAEARTDAHRLRAESDAVMVGSGTQQADNPPPGRAARGGVPPATASRCRQSGTNPRRRAGSRRCGSDAHRRGGGRRRQSSGGPMQRRAVAAGEQRRVGPGSLAPRAWRAWGAHHPPGGRPNPGRVLRRCRLGRPGGRLHRAGAHRRRWPLGAGGNWCAVN